MGTPRSPAPVFQVDAFTAEPFRGNPAAVCLLHEPAPAEWMQALAAEMNLSETAYVVPAGDDQFDLRQFDLRQFDLRQFDLRQFDLRWFTPTVEVELCGHATLASAHVLLEQEQVPPGSTIAFRTRSGVLRASGTPGRIELDFPAYTPTDGPVPDGLADALGAEPTGVAIVAERDSLFVELADAATVRALRPDFAALRAVVDTVGVTAPADDDRADFVSRYFAPGAGIDEDPVTGSAHCVLGPYWAAKLGRTELTGYQASARGGYVGVRLVRSSKDGDRALLTGDAVTVWSGSLEP